ncbi:uncharacterized protein LOC129225828 [Uloborus diversus]|uniref:uncharacterized protein LOC129225828 n=1 Tax=Uloborus diversus TaxID=327109 RepID=UPI002409B7DD|nr:uncharacterized protein LOC129225828 [Uloborus diversus]XP_054716320.1 uncharacterized protein LOC129225828 [Uloborus diversus]
MFLPLLLCFLPSAFGQLILGFCPEPPPFVHQLDWNKYSGDWYTVAQSSNHPLKASDCQRVRYSRNQEGFDGTFSLLHKPTNSKVFENGTFWRESHKTPGELKFRLKSFPRSYQFRVLHTNYTDTAVEYLCLGGALTHITSISVLHRHSPSQLPLQHDLEQTLRQLNLSHVIPPPLRSKMTLIDHTAC